MTVGIEVTEGQQHGLVLYDAQDAANGAGGPRYPAGRRKPSEQRPAAVVAKDVRYGLLRMERMRTSLPNFASSALSDVGA
jgi:hypothetical protein